MPLFLSEGCHVLFLLTCAVHGSQFLPPYARGGQFAEEHPELVPNDALLSNAALTIDLPLDHFGSEETRTYPNRYYTDETYFDQEGTGPIFVEMGGEGPCTGVGLSEYHKEHSALAVGIEHRFFGDSTPFMDRSVANLKYLTVEQNLADTAALIVHLQQVYGNKNRTVVTFGGSYSGATSAWMRVAHPDVVDAAYSTSGVVNAILDFQAFDEQVFEALQSPSTSADCSSLLRQTTSAMERAFEAGQADTIKQQFGASNLIGTKLGDTDFWYMVADGAAMADQYGSKQHLCQALEGAGGATEATPTDDQLIQALADFQTAHYGPTFGQMCFYDSECVQDLSEVGMDRSWRWIKCNQLAYLQSAPAKNSLRSSALTLEALLEQCTYVFGDDITPQVDAFNSKFGGDEPKASNVVFLDFSDDPWQRASVNRTLSADLPYCMTTCDGCGHCGAGASAEVKAKCENEAKAYIAKWITEAEESKLK